MQPPPPQNPGHLPPNPNAVLVNRRQEGNPVLKHLKNVRWQFADILPDYEAGPSTGVLFLSLRFHLLKPAYIFGRMRATARAYRLVVLLCHVDTEAAAEPLNDVARAALGNECTLLCAWSPQECASYLELLKLHEPRAGEAGPRAARQDAAASLQAALTSVRGVTKADVKTLGDRFGTLARLFEATEKELEECPGIGPTKVRRLIEAFREPFYRTGAGAALSSSQADAGPSEPAPRGADAAGAGAEEGATGPLVEDDVESGSDRE